MRIEFSEHAKERLKDRGISVQRVLAVIEKPHQVEKSFRGRNLLKKSFGSRILEVVVIEENGKTVVVSAYYLDKNYEN